MHKTRLAAAFPALKNGNSIKKSGYFFHIRQRYCDFAQNNI